MANTSDPRLKQLMDAAVRHLHAFAREVNLTPAEWLHGIQFLTANPLSGLDWPVRMLVFEDERETVWIACTDFAWIARRHGITDRAAAFAMATKVVASIVASVNASPA